LTWEKKKGTAGCKTHPRKKGREPGKAGEHEISEGLTSTPGSKGSTSVIGYKGKRDNLKGRQKHQSEQGK